ncbi:hypothetical protein SKAU_G00373080 [Synaphobranchus kaupii]|uniref:Uncharacterized protein n=1 Tax=Synaphobranchus kaupii TaxID=118154 RepID=A0A9Q1IG08_SYNKA|nr:hypothetical protein SKAU_G00373080 [Synaphobranchus kaupii]
MMIRVLEGDDHQIGQGKKLEGQQGGVRLDEIGLKNHRPSVTVKLSEVESRGGCVRVLCCSERQGQWNLLREELTGIG